eukprot:1324173-Pleurochrysis_carterae.AAC.1
MRACARLVEFQVGAVFNRDIWKKIASLERLFDVHPSYARMRSRARKPVDEVVRASIRARARTTLCLSTCKAHTCNDEVGYMITKRHSSAVHLVMCGHLARSPFSFRSPGRSCVHQWSWTVPLSWRNGRTI